MMQRVEKTSCAQEGKAENSVPGGLLLAKWVLGGGL